MYVIDEDGNSEFCDVKLILQDSPNKKCFVQTQETSRPLYPVKVVNKTATGFENIAVDLKTWTMPAACKVPQREKASSISKMYLYFNEYQLKAVKMTTSLNGLSTLDLVLIQRHLGNETHRKPYDLIAADINKDKNWLPADLVGLRKVILGIDKQFVSNESWRFVPSNYVFADPRDPHNFWRNRHQRIESGYGKSWLHSGKTGDVNNSATQQCKKRRSENRTSPALLLIKDQAYKTGETVRAGVSAGESMEVSWHTIWLLK